MDRAWIRGRRGAVMGASAAVVCLGSLLAACGAGASADGHVPLGAAGADSGASGAPQKPVPPSGEVTLVPLDGAGEGDGKGRGEGGSGAGRGSESGGAAGTDRKAGAGEEAKGTAGAEGAEGAGGAKGGPGGGSGSPDPASGESAGTGGASGGGSGGGTGSGGATGGGGTPEPGGGGTAGPAVLKVGEPVLAAADKRWCDRVTVKFHNSGGTAVRSGTVTFGTHVIGGLGVDWATIESTEKLPAPIAPGATEKKTWTVCVAEWRVPLGMHVETRDVAVKWK
ncbi:hypothetical protein DY218_07430 [Streptomyces triticagri]|uniref:Secreted protein n=1 Tax=Streptomyces triticagri TaxID=2293568 RepID=A0A372MAA7_9ACTN|nr:hypothetical protein [Streptomyces triticagri]RFU87353.1 hypothetical protein DY218_07430 [Streptomyces triticagri]